jgi:hypothetical protein
MAKTTCVILGALFLLVGLLGFAAPNFLGMHLTTGHNLIHLVSGAIALFIGWRGTLQAARTLCFIFGAVYLLLALYGFVAGGPNRMVEIVPGEVMFGTADHVVHLLLGAIFLIGAFATRPAIATHPERH